MKGIISKTHLLFWLIALALAPQLPEAGAACPEKEVLIVVSNHFGPYITASNALEKELETNCPRLLVKKIFLDQDKTIARRFKKQSIALILPVGTEAAMVVHRLFPGIPAVFSMVLDPSPVLTNDPNDFGVVLDIPYKQVVKRLCMLAPYISTIGILYTNESESMVHRITDELSDTRLQVVKIKLKSTEHLEERLDEVLRLADALVAIPDMNIYNSIVAPRIIFEAIRHKKPFVGLSKNFTLSGALFSLDCDYKDIGMQAAEMGLDILAGHIPDTRIRYPRKFTAYLNLYTARLIGLSPNSKVLEAFKVVVY